MKNILWIIMLFPLLIGCTSNSAKQNQGKTEVSNKNKSGIIYTCPMHSEVISDKPGVCPKCGMDLVEKDSTKKE